MVKKAVRRNALEDTFYNTYHRVPVGVKRYSDPLLKAGIRVERSLKPIGNSSVKADLWLEKHVKSRFNPLRRVASVFSKSKK